MNELRVRLCQIFFLKKKRSTPSLILIINERKPQERKTQNTPVLSSLQKICKTGNESTNKGIIKTLKP